MFYISKGRLSNWCKNCFSNYRKEFKKNNPDASKKQYIKYKEKTITRVHDWYQNNRQRAIDKVTKWRLNNKEKRCIESSNRRASIKSSGKITLHEWNSVKEFYGNKCLCCGMSDVKLTIDHIKPISLGGAHNINNIQPLCGSCNSHKHTKETDYRNGKYYAEP
jgi:5-methylcytosine-specific restriction endonuclease McrA